MTLKKTVLAAVTLAGFAAGASLMATESYAAKEGFEKCAGIVKAGKNDCAANNHSCAGHAKMDSDANEWVFVPKGTCDKIVGGSVVK